MYVYVCLSVFVYVVIHVLVGETGWSPEETLGYDSYFSNRLYNWSTGLEITKYAMLGGYQEST